MPQTPSRLPHDCMYETRQTELFPTASDFMFITKREMQRAYHLVRAELEVEHNCLETHYNYRDYGPTYNKRQQVFVFFATVEKEKQKNHLLLSGPQTNVEIINDLNFRVCNDRKRKDVEVSLDKLNEYKN